jgi:hypothetical protein
MCHGIVITIIHSFCAPSNKQQNNVSVFHLVPQGLRVTLLSGAAIMTTGAWIKVLSASPDSFYLAFLGQSLVGTAQIFILGVPARLAAVWFGSKQVSTACALGVFGNQVRLGGM